IRLDADPAAEISLKSRMSHLELVDAEVDGIEAIDASVVAVGGEPDTGLHAGQGYMRAANHRARGVQHRAAHCSPACLGIGSNRQDQKMYDFHVPSYCFSKTNRCSKRRPSARCPVISKTSSFR